MGEAAHMAGRRQRMIRLAILLGLSLLGLIAVLSAGCKDETGLKFSHQGHQARTPQCAVCHPPTAQGEITRAAHAQCQACHKIAADKPGPECLACHTAEDQRTTRRSRPSFAASAPRHQLHAAQKIDCQACHGPVQAKDKVEFPRMEACVACHFPQAGARPEGKCGYCHQGLSPQARPASHVKSWTQGHGRQSLTEPFLCERCHRENSCEQCHRVSPPQDHTNVFKQRGHGMLAMGNPQRCDTCHQQDFCQSCHLNSQPKYHTATFKTSRPYTHCGMCHIPIDEGNRCRACHRRDVPHNRAKSLATPAPPFAVSPCFPCHPVNLVPVRHLYNAVPDTECLGCHQKTSNFIPRFPVPTPTPAPRAPSR